MAAITILVQMCITHLWFINEHEEMLPKREHQLSLLTEIKSHLWTGFRHIWQRSCNRRWPACKHIAWL